MEIEVKNKFGEKLSCNLSETGSKSLLYIVPGEGEHKNQRAYQFISKVAKTLSIDTLRCDLSAMGKSQGNTSENNLDKRINDILFIHNKVRKNYERFYFLGYSFGALAGLISSTKIKFHKQFLFSTALFAENRDFQEDFLKEWKKLGTLPDWNSFQKGKIKPAKQKLKYDFVKSLKKYGLFEVCKNINSETFLFCGEREPLFRKQNNQIFKALRTKKHKSIIKGVGHEINNNKYLAEIKKLLDKELK